MKGRVLTGVGMIALIMMFVSVGAAAGGGNYYDADSAVLPMVLAYHGKPLCVIPQPQEEGSCWYVTESGYIAAVDEELLDRAIFWAGVGDAAEFEKFITSNPLVFPLRAGLRVQIDKFSFSDKVRIRPRGSSISVWTVREAIRSEVPMDGS